MSKKFIKSCSKIVSSLLTATMVLSAIPVMAFAEELPDDTQEVTTETVISSEDESVVIEVVEPTTEEDENVTSIPVDETVDETEVTEDVERPPETTEVVEETDETTTEVEETEATEVIDVEETEVTEEVEEVEYIEFDHKYSDVDTSVIVTADLFIKAPDASVFTRNTNVVSNYDDVYIVSCSSVEEARFVYTYYVDKVEYITDLSAAVSIATDDEDVADLTDLNNGSDAIANLNDISVTNDYSGYIALIDTGANADANFSVIGDNTSDNQGHGTLMLESIRETNPDAKVISIKVSENGSASAADIYAGFMLARELNVSVINFSMTAPNIEKNAIIVDVINETLADGIVVIGAAGNNSTNATNFIPGCINGVITVGAVNDNGTLFPTSNYNADVYVVANSTSVATAKYTGLYTAGNTSADIVFTAIVENPTDDTQDGDRIDFDGGYAIFAPTGYTYYYFDDGSYLVVDPEGNGTLTYQEEFEAADPGTGASAVALGEITSPILVPGATGTDTGLCDFDRTSAGYGTMKNIRSDGNAAYQLSSFISTLNVECEGHYDNSTDSWYAFALQTGTNYHYAATYRVEQGTDGKNWIYWQVDLSNRSNLTSVSWSKVNVSVSWVVGSEQQSPAQMSMSVGGMRYYATVNGREVYSYKVPYTQSEYYATASAQAVAAAVAEVRSHVPTITAYGGNKPPSGWSNLPTGLGSGTATNSYLHTTQYQIYERSITAWQYSMPYIYVNKSANSAFNPIINGNSCYSLAGTQYQLYKGNTLVQTFTMDANGNCGAYYQLEANTTYTLRETIAGNGFALDTATYTFTTGSSPTSPITVKKDGQNYATYTPVRKSSGSSSWYEFTVQMVDEPLLDNFNIRLFKVDANGTRLTTSALNGAVYQVDYYANSDASGNAVASYRVTATGDTLEITLETLANDATLVGGSNYMKTVYDALAAMPGDVTSLMPLGSYKISEYSAPAGWTKCLSEEIYVISQNPDARRDASADPTTVTLLRRSTNVRGWFDHTIVNTTEGDSLRLTLNEIEVRGGVSLKKELNLNDVIAGGFRFELWNTTTNTLIATGVTQANGTVLWTYDNSLDLKAPNGNSLAGTTTTTAVVPTYYNAQANTLNNYEIREVSLHQYHFRRADGSEASSIYTYSCPEGWTERVVNGQTIYVSPTFNVPADTSPETIEPANIYSITCGNVEDYGSLRIRKTLANANDNTTDRTFTFDIYDISDGSSRSLLTTVSITIPAGQTSGTTTITEVPLGTYLCVERPNSDFVISYPNNGDQTVVVDEDHKHTGIFEFNVVNTLKTYDINFIKNTILPDGTAIMGTAGDASFENAQYRVFRDMNGNSRYDENVDRLVGTYTTDADGHFSTVRADFDPENPRGALVVGYTYCVEETVAPEGYERDTNVYVIRHTGTEFAEAYKEYETPTNISNPTLNDYTSAEPVYDGRISLIKFYNTPDSVTMDYEANVKFAIYLTSAGSYENARDFERTIITTNAQGYAISGQLPYGTYTVHQMDGTESYADGYEYPHLETNNCISDFQVVLTNANPEYTNHWTYSTIKVNTLIELALFVRKTDAVDGEVIPYAGAEFELYVLPKDDDGKTIADAPMEDWERITLKVGRDEYTTFSTDERGVIAFDQPFPVGIYKLVEVNAPYGYYLAEEPFTVTMTVRNIAGHTVIGVSNNTKEYGLIDTAVPNRPQWFNVNVTKSGDGFTSVTTGTVTVAGEETALYTPNWTTVNLAGAEFTITATEDIYSETGRLWYSEGQVVGTIVTDENGVAATDGSIVLTVHPEYAQQVADGIITGLPLGSYKITETAAPVGYTISNFSQTFTGTYQGQEISVFDVSAGQCVNEPFIPELTIYKDLLEGPVDGTEDEMITERDYTQVVFGIYTTVALTAANGDVIPAGSLVEVLTCDKDGKAVSTVNYPFSEYEVRELETDTWHLIADTNSYLFNYECPVSRTSTNKVISLGINDMQPVINEAENPKLGTTLTYNDSHMAPACDENGNPINITLVDTVSYTDLKPNSTYVVSGYLMIRNADGSSEVYQKDASGNPIRVSATVTTGAANNSNGLVDGSVDLEFTVNSADADGATFVAFEYLYHANILVAVHADITDEGQSVHVPGIGTTFTYGSDHLVPAVDEDGNYIDIELVDKVEYSNVIPNMEYTVTGVLYVRGANNESILLTDAEGKAISASINFIPEESDGFVELTFTVNTEGLAGKTLVAFEDLYLEDVLLDVEHEITNEGQSVHIPDIGTTLLGKETESHIVPANAEVTLVDYVAYENLIPGKTYTMTGTLYIRETNAALKDANGQPVTSTVTFVPTTANGVVDVEFTIDTTNLVGKHIVAFEDCYYEDLHLAFEHDINDLPQTVVTPEIGTTLTYNNDHIAPMNTEIDLVDIVAYENLAPKTEYSVEGILMIKDANGSRPYSEEPVVVTFTTGDANSEDGMTVSGTVAVHFLVDTTDCAGTTLVAFEELFYGEVSLCEHKDINDEGQSVRVPDIGTVFTDRDSETHVAPRDTEVTLVDTVAYENLIPGKTYVMTGTIMVKETNQPLMQNGEAVTATIEFEPETPNGVVELEFVVDTTTLAGKHLVAFEDCSLGDLHLAWEHDIDDEDQTVKVPNIGTVATVNGSKTFKPGDTITLVDEIAYENLVPGETYFVSGNLMTVNANGEAVPFTVNGVAVTATGTFVASETGNGVTSVTFTFKGSDLVSGQKLVVFEEVRELNAEGRLMAEHKDASDANQTVTVVTPTPTPPPTITRTGEVLGATFYGGIAALGAGLMMIVLRLRKRHIEEGEE